MFVPSKQTMDIAKNIRSLITLAKYKLGIDISGYSYREAIKVSEDIKTIREYETTVATNGVIQAFNLIMGSSKSKSRTKIKSSSDTKLNPKAKVSKNIPIGGGVSRN